MNSKFYVLLDIYLQLFQTNDMDRYKNRIIYFTK